MEGVLVESFGGGDAVATLEEPVLSAGKAGISSRYIMHLPPPGPMSHPTVYALTPSVSSTSIRFTTCPGGTPLGFGGGFGFDTQGAPTATLGLPVQRLRRKEGWPRHFTPGSRNPVEFRENGPEVAPSDLVRS